ncbi:potassium channel family protein [Streptomyces antarcticus]|uniref:potassium channel family protein n=1 Tax=Streptomyces antarcticus TaxID=2996458 RepID=UPI00226F9115|nr:MULTISPECIES: potassium channel protein [unclassified Streptomyces]MCY0941427.1 NAD-binding protein [Streptomyces sp. H34-AA3]MCZ4085059.1 NAD-binding protein [Streptomyces sp. H34-S5]
MVVCGDDGLARRLASELREVYKERVTLVAPASRDAQPSVGRAAGAPGRGLLGRVPLARARNAGGGQPAVRELRVLEAAEPDEEVLATAGVAGAAALALVYEDDDTNVRAALVARRLNPRLRLVIRLYNRKLGQHLEELLDQAAMVAEPGIDLRELDSSTTVLSDADTAAPALAASAVAGTSKVVQADGLLLRAVERTPPGRGEVADPGLCTLALLSATTSDPAGAEGAESSGDRGPQLLPDDRAVASATGRGIVALETVTHADASQPRQRLGGAGALPVASLFSRRLRWSLAGMVAAVAALAVASWVTTGDHPLHAAYITLLDIFAINDPAVGDPTERQVLQILSGFVGLLLLPVLVAAALEALGAFRTATVLRRPPRGLSGHVVLLGLGKIGTRVLARMRELEIPVVCVEADPQARGLALARRLRVPVIIGDVTDEGVLEAARVHRAHSLLALTSSDTTNLEAALYARTVQPGLRAVLRLYEDDFATAVYRTLRAAHPAALTRSRSVTHLAAPAFAGAMMGRQILGAIPVERRVLLFAAVDVAGHPYLEGRTIAESFRPGAWRVLALDTASPEDRRPDLASAPADGPSRQSGLVWDLHPGYVLKPEDRVVLAATRRGLAELLGRVEPAPHRPDGRI